MAVLTADPPQLTPTVASGPAAPPPAPTDPSTSSSTPGSTPSATSGLTPTIASAPPAEPDIVDKVNTLSDSQRKYFFSQMNDDQRTRFQAALQAKIAAKQTQPLPSQPAQPGLIQRFQNAADKLVNAPITDSSGKPINGTGFDTGLTGQAERFGQGVLQGGESIVAHPIQTAHSAVDLPLDMMRATGITAIGEPTSDPEVQKIIHDARARLGQQWEQAKENPAQTIGQLVGGGIISHGISETTDLGLRTAGNIARSTGEAATGAADVVSGASDAVRKAGEKAATTQVQAGEANAGALKDYAAKVEKATQTIDEQKVAAAKKVADWDALQHLDHATQVEHLEAQQATDAQAADITHEQARQQAQQLYAKNVQDVSDLDSQRGELARQEKQARIQLMRTAQEQEVAARTNAGAQFNDVRKAIGPAEAPVDTLGDAVRAAVNKNIKGSAEKIPIFQDMLNRAKNSGEQAELTQNVMKSQGLSGEYDALPPERKAVVDKIVEDINSRSGAPPEPPKTMSWDNWRGYSSELGRMLQNPNLESDVRGALRDVKNHVDAVAQKMAEDAGPEIGEKFRDAKRNWSIYKDVFHEAEGPSGSGSPVAKSINAEDAFHATQPFLHDNDFVAQRARDLLVGDKNAGPGGYYNPEAGKVVDRLRDIHAQQDALPEGKLVEPPKLKPDAAPVDIRQVKLKAYQAAADKLKQLNKFQIRAILGVGGGIVAHILGHGAEGSLGYGLGTTVGLTGLGMLVDSDTFKKWISAPRPRDFRMLEKLDNANKIRVQDGIADEIVRNIESGGKVKVSPDTQAFIGARNIVKVAKALKLASNAKGTVAGMTGAEKVRAGVKAGLVGAGAIAGATGASRVETGTSQGAQQ